MKIGIDVSQTAYQGTGVANYLLRLVENMVDLDKESEFILFSSSLRQRLNPEILKFSQKNKNVKIVNSKIPPRVLNIIWNRLHVLPIETFVGDVDLFITSDWTEPPARKAKKATIIYDLIVYKYPNETDSSIVNTQKRKLKWVTKESDAVFCISEATKKDVQEILGIDEKKLHVVYPG